MTTTLRSFSVATALAGALALAGPAGAASAPRPAAPASTAASAVPAARKAADKPIDINSARPEQLMSLPGIGKDEAARIVAGRPYLSKASLVTDKVLPAGVYQAIRHRIVAIQKTDRTRRPGGASAAR